MQLTEFTLHRQDFMRELKHNGLAQLTLAAYQRDLKELFILLAAAGAALNAEIIDRSFFTWSLKKLSLQNLHPSTIARKVSVWRKYNRYLTALADTPDFLQGIKLPKIPQRLPKAVNAEELNRIFDFPENSKRSPFLLKRDQAIFELMYGSGLRVSEIQQLNIANLELEAGWVTVTGKGSKTRQIPLTVKSINALNAYLALHPAAAPDRALFTGTTSKRITCRRIEQALNEWAQRREANLHLSPHMLRHSFATEILQGSQDIRAVQELLGHSQLSTTQIYTKLDFQHLAAIYDRTHPRAKKKNKT